MPRTRPSLPARTRRSVGPLETASGLSESSLVAYCSNCGGQLPDSARFCPLCAAPTQAEADPKPPPLDSPAGPVAGPNESARLAWTLGGLVIGLLGGLIAVRLTNQALCPHSILGPCQALTSKGRDWILVAAVVVGGILGRLIGAARGRRR
jgi:hypothetical protein